MKRSAIIVDVDGTLADSPHVAQFMKPTGGKDWNAWIEATKFAPVNQWCADMVRGMMLLNYEPVFLTARTGDDKSRQITKEYIEQVAGFHNPTLFMRGKMDFRPDFEVKRDIYINQIAPYYDVAFAIDDKKLIIDMWRSIGLVALHCKDY